jgi:hypothetical protein
VDEVLLKQQLSVVTDLDRVVFNFNRLGFPMPYAQSFKIAAGLRLASKHAMKISGESIKDWRNRSRLDVYQSIDEINPERRSTMTRQFKWRVDVDGEMVYLILADHQIGMHFETALKIAEWLRLAGRKAKRWAGDTGRIMTATGNLTDAENNYKRGY